MEIVLAILVGWLAPILFVVVVLAIPTLYILIRDSAVEQHRMFKGYRDQAREARLTAAVAPPEIVVKDVRCHTEAFPLLHINEEGKWVK